MARILSVVGTLLILGGWVGIGAAPAPVAKNQVSSNVVVMDTSLGKILIRLYPDKAPLSVANFLKYADTGFYDDLVFHRVIPNFMIQGGGYTSGLLAKRTQRPIKNEAANGLKNKRGTIVCARAAAPDSATSQFFINVRDNAYLDADVNGGRPGYCVFGEVIEGMSVVDEISKVKTAACNGHNDVPVKEVVIRSVRRVKK